jgi:hypothetical protein
VRPIYNLLQLEILGRQSENINQRVMYDDVNEVTPWSDLGLGVKWFNCVLCRSVSSVLSTRAHTTWPKLCERLAL